MRNPSSDDFERGNKPFKKIVSFNVYFGYEKLSAKICFNTMH